MKSFLSHCVRSPAVKNRLMLVALIALSLAQTTFASNPVVSQTKSASTGTTLTRNPASALKKKKKTLAAQSKSKSKAPLRTAASSQSLVTRSAPAIESVMNPKNDPNDKRNFALYARNQAEKKDFQCPYATKGDRDSQVAQRILPSDSTTKKATTGSKSVEI